MDDIKQAINEILKAIKNLEYAGEEVHEGPLIDLANIFRKIIKEYKKKGISYVVDTYWNPRKEKLL